MGAQKILIVTNTQGMLVSSLKNMLDEQRYEISIKSANIKEVTKIDESYDAILLYLDEELAENTQVLIYLRDVCVENNTSVFVIGDQAEIDSAEKVMPKTVIAKNYTRPVNMTEIAEDINSYMKDHNLSDKKKILVVDDSGAMLRNVKGWLEDKYQVILANSGAMAIKYLTLNRPDLVLLDYEMPVVDGAQVLEMIRSERDFADIPVIFLTSKNDKESVSNVVKLKVDGYLLKTMKPDEIVKQIDDFFVKQKSKLI